MRQASIANLDLIEITEKSTPPVARIADQGKYQYEQNKLKKKWAERDKERGKKQKETKKTQFRPGTSGGALTLRVNKIREWLDEGNRVHIDLFLFGRYKGMDEEFLKEKFTSFLDLIPGEIHMVEGIKRSPKGFSVVLQSKS